MINSFIKNIIETKIKNNVSCEDIEQLIEKKRKLYDKNDAKISWPKDYNNLKDDLINIHYDFKKKKNMKKMKNININIIFLKIIMKYLKNL